MAIRIRSLKNSYLKTTSVWRELSHHWLIKIPAYVCLLSLFIQLIYIFLHWNKLPPQVPLWLSRAWGEYRLAHPMYLFLLPAVNLLVYIINLTISAYLNREYLILIYLLFISSFFVSIVSLLVVINVINLVV